ncbi:MAG: PAS domain S-box protein, partial [Chloroflexi bacterium]|nr:PAS domain S-box protein [Chloroflexota bacterium]
MTLRIKTLLIAGTMILGMTALVYIISYSIVLDSFAQLEEHFIRQDVGRALDAISDRLSNLEATVTDYAGWDDTYAFMDDLNESYITSNLVDATFNNLGLNVIVPSWNSGNIAIAKSYDLVNEMDAPVPTDFLARLRSDSRLRQKLTQEDSATGIVLLDRGPMLVAAHAILTSQGEGPRRGTFLMGRYLDAMEIEQLAHITHLSFDVSLLDGMPAGTDSDVIQNLQTMFQEGTIIIRPQGAETITGYTLLMDIAGEPAVVLRVVSARAVYAQGQNTVQYFLAVLGLVMLVYGALTMLLLERSVLARLAQLSANVGRIGSSGDFTARVVEGKPDELGRLSSAINKMLAALDNAQKMLQQSERRYRSLIENGMDVIMVIDDTHTIRYESPAVSHILGYTPEERVGRNVNELIHPDDWHRASNVLNLVSQHPGMTHHDELRVHHKDGTWRCVEGTIKNLLDDPSIQGIVTNYRDITERKRAEGALHREQEFTRTLLDNLVDGVVACDAEGNLALFNRKAREWHGTDAMRLPPEEWAAHYHLYGPDGITPLATHANPLARAFEGETVREVGMVICTPGQPARHVLANGGPFFDEQGRKLGAVVNIHDVTADRQAAEALKRYQLLSQHTRDIVCFVRAQDGCILEANSAAATYGYTREELLRKTIYDLLAPGAAPLSDALLAQANAGGIVFEHVHLRKDRSAFPVEVSLVGANLGNEWVLMSIVRDITERKRAEEALRESENRLRLYFEHANDLIFTVDAAGRIRSVNRAVCTLTGYRPEELEGRTPLEFIAPDSRALAAEAFANIWQGENVEQIELDIVTKSGAGRTIEMRGRKFFRDGSIFELLETGRDITERKRAEEALRVSEQRYRSLFNEMTEGFATHEIICNENGTPCDYRFLEVNPAFEKLTGMTRNEVVGRTLYEVLPDSEPFWVETYGRVALTGQPVHFEQYSAALNRYYEVYAYCPAPREFATLFVDITERKHAEEALRESEAKFRSYVEHAPIAVFVVDREGRYVDCNPAAVELLGYDIATLAGLHIPDIVPSEDHEALLRDLDTLARGRQIEGEYRLKRRDGQLIWVSLRAVTLADGRALAYCQDTTARKRAEEQIRQQLVTLTALYTGAQKLAESLDSLKLTADTTRACVESFGLKLAWLGRAEPDGGVHLVAQFPAEMDYPRQITVRWDDTPEGCGPVGQAIRTGAPIVVDDPLNDPRVSPWRAAVQQYGFGSGAAFPLINRNQAFGVLMLYSDQTDYFTPARVQFFQSYALQVASALENARLFEETNRRLSNVQALRVIDLAITSNLDLHKTLDVILKQAAAQLKVDAASILLLDSQTQVLNYAAGRGFRTSTIQQTHLTMGKSYAGRAARERRTIINESYQREDGASVDSIYPALVATEGFATHIVTPLLVKGQVKGVLEVFHRTMLDTDDEWLAFLETLAGQAAISIDNATLFEGLQRAHAELELAYDTTLEGWARALELRDGETENHCRRVMDWTVRLASAMGIVEPDLVHIRRGALLHDIGKIGVPDDILRKPGPLTAEEWQIMRQHPTLA